MELVMRPSDMMTADEMCQVIENATAEIKDRDAEIARLRSALFKVRIGLGDPMAGEDPAGWLPVIDAALNQDGE
jgi:hypothetical protein